MSFSPVHWNITYLIVSLHDMARSPLHFHAKAQCLHVSFAADTELVQQEVPKYEIGNNNDTDTGLQLVMGRGDGRSG